MHDSGAGIRKEHINKTKHPDIRKTSDKKEKNKTKKEQQTNQALVCTLSVHESHLDNLHISACWTSLARLTRVCCPEVWEYTGDQQKKKEKQKKKN